MGSTAIATTAVCAGLVASAGADRAQRDQQEQPTPFAATREAAIGREVPSQVAERYRDEAPARVVGLDRSGSELALTQGNAGVCLVAVRGKASSGFEACGPDVGRDLVTTVFLGERRLQTFVLQADETEAPPEPGATRVAPGLWEVRTTGRP